MKPCVSFLSIFSPSSLYHSEARSLDYTVFSKAVASLGPDYDYHSPRVYIPDQLVYVAPSESCGAHAADIEARREGPYAWPYEVPPDLSSTLSDCHPYIPECMLFGCSTHENLHLYVWDTERERRMGLGRGWKHEAIPSGEALLSKDAAMLLHAKVGDTVLAAVSLAPPLTGLFVAANASQPDFPYSRWKTTVMPVRVAGIIDDEEGKFATVEDFYMVMELHPFLAHAAAYMDPDMPAPQRAAVASADVRRFASEILVNLSPAKRRAAYLVNNYDEIQIRVVSWAATLLYHVGFNQVQTEAGILEYMRGVRFFSLFLGLIISLVIVVLLALAVILIYSLLMINVETRTFELGVLRMIGMKRANLVELVLTQAFLYALPAWALGLAVSGVAWAGIRAAMESAILVELPATLDATAVGLATLVGIFMPVVASFFPIRQCLGMSLQDSLDTSRSATEAVTFKYERAEDTTFSVPALVLGTAMAVFGFCIYYLFPLALLSFNIALLFYIFFGVLLGMLFGLILLALNFERVVERVLTHAVFFWENYAVRSMVLMNLTAHRMRNRKTTLMYALSLGFIIWINVSWELQVQSVSFRARQKLGAEMMIQKGKASLGYHEVLRIEEALRESSPHIVADWGYLTEGLQHLLEVKNNRITSFGKYKSFPCWLVGVSPNFFGTLTDEEFLKVTHINASHAASASEQLYTRWGHDRVAYGSLYYASLGQETLDSTQPGMNLQIEVLDDSGEDYEKLYVPMKAAVVMDSAPVLRVSQFPARLKQHVAVSIPTFIALSHGLIGSTRDLRFQKIVVRMADGATEDDIDTVKAKIYDKLQPDVPVNHIKIRSLESETRAVKSASRILQMFFAFVTAITMTLCFFSLTASMYTNILLQSKEIGILRSLGLTTFATTRLYIWEAFVLVLTASLMGFLVGTIVAFTMVIQRALFLQLPLQFRFPFVLFILVIALAFVFSLVSSWAPARNLLKNSIVTILRKTH